MPPLSRALLVVLAASLPLVGCESDEPSVSDAAVEETGEPGLLGQAQAMADAVQGLEEAANRPAAEAVDFRRLRDALPAEVGGLAQRDAEGGRQEMMGMAVARAAADYGDPSGSGPRFRVSVTDVGAVPAVGALGLGWTMAQVDNETAGGGYERTVTLGGHKGYRTFAPPDRRTFSLLVADRFHVEVEGTGATDDAVEAALRAVDLDALAAMRDEGRPAE